MNRLDFYFRQAVTEAELDKAFTYCEDADKALLTDAGIYGIMSGLDLTVNDPTPNLTVDVAAGKAYDMLGQRIYVASKQDVDCSVDYNGTGTAVVTPGNEKWLSIFIRFGRSLTDPRTDGNSATVYFERSEAFSFRVVQGAEAVIGAASKPALDPNGILLADVRLTQGLTAIPSGNINTQRRQMQFVGTGNAYSFSAGTVREALLSLLGAINSIPDGDISVPAHAVEYAGGPNWRDGNTNPASSVETQLDKIVSDLTGTSGAQRIGAAEFDAGWFQVPAGSIYEHVCAALQRVGDHENNGTHLEHAGVSAHSGADFAVTSATYVDTGVTFDAGVLRGGAPCQVNVHVLFGSLTGATSPSLRVVAVENGVTTNLIADLDIGVVSSPGNIPFAFRYTPSGVGSTVFKVLARRASGTFNIWVTRSIITILQFGV